MRQRSGPAIKSREFRFLLKINAGLPNGQEKSGNQEKLGKTKQNDKSQVKMGVFEKSQEK